MLSTLARNPGVKIRVINSVTSAFDFMSRKQKARSGNPDLRRATQVPAPEIAEIEAKLWYWLSPESFKPLSLTPDDKKRRDRLLTLPVMMAVVLSLVYRRISGLSEVVRVLESEGLLWQEPLKVSKQALSKRLACLPAQLFGQVFEQTIAKMRSKAVDRLPIPADWESVCQSFNAIWIADGSTLEALRKKLKANLDSTKGLGGRMMMIVEAFNHQPIASWYTNNSASHDQNWTEQLLERLPIGGLLIFDLGFFNFVWFDAFTDSKKFFVTRLRQKTAYQAIRTLSSGTLYKDEIIKMGKYRSNPCNHQVRLVSVLWGKTWYYYLTNVTDPQKLSARQVCELYRRRWRVEEAFLLTKRLLGLSYLWVSGNNGVEIQLYATWIFYAVLNDLCSSVAVELGQPKERISIEMVFRGLYHFSRYLLRGKMTDAVTYLVEHHKMLGLIKQERKRHRDNAAIDREIWESTA